ncbi:MAG: TIM-barrel domain-containing protein [Planctomycetota bacterium]
MAPGGLIGEPSFGTESDGRRQVRIDIPAGTSIYGTGLVTGSLERTGEFVELWNTDAPGWADSNDRLYQSHPWVLLVHADGSATGVLFDTIERAEIDTTGDSGFGLVFRAAQSDLPVYTINKSTPPEVVQTLYHITGTPPLPPLWALGYHQSRGSYTTDAVLRSVAGELRDRRIPTDVLWIDVGYMDGFRMFTWDGAKVPDPAALTGDLNTMGFETVASLGGFIRVDPAWPTFHEVAGGARSVRLPDGVSPYVGDVWPGPCIFLDSLNASARTWYVDKLSDFLLDSGVTGAWIDMSEPAVFNGPDQTMPENTIHLADADLGGTDDHARYHNAYGMQLSRTAFLGVQDARPDRRPFVLSRAGALGGQRYTWNWSGDNRASWYHVDVSIQQLLNLGLSGQPFSGPDIGGYLDPIDPQMYRRWMGIGAMMPFARQHTAGDESPPKEPWVFGLETERVGRLAVQRRYRLLPHLYTLAYRAHTDGIPLAQPVFFADPSNASLREEDDAFLLGEGLIVASATSPEAIPSTPDLPGREVQFGFREVDGGNAPIDLCESDLPHLSVRGGHIVPFHASLVQHTKDGYGNDYGLLVALDNSGIAVGELYEDAGDGFGYQSGDYLLTTYHVSRVGGGLILSIQTEQGQRPRPIGRMLDVRLLIEDGAEHRVTVSEPTTNNPTLIENVPISLLAIASCAETLPAAIDGVQIPSAFPWGGPVTQTQPTGMGDNANELNQLFADLRPDTLRLGLTGNLSEGDALLLFIDAGPGGAQVIPSAGLTTEPNPVRSLPGTRMDVGFTPEVLLSITVSGDGTLTPTLYRGIGSGPAEKVDLGRGLIGLGSGALISAFEPEGHAVLVGYDAGNTAGVAAQSATGAATAARGFEIDLPTSLLRDDATLCQPVRVLAALAFSVGFVGDQVLPPAGSPSLLPAQAPDFTAIGGQQFLEVDLVAFDRDSSGSPVDTFDLAGHLSDISSANALADLTLDGVIDRRDIDSFFSALTRCRCETE